MGKSGIYVNKTAQAIIAANAGADPYVTPLLLHHKMLQIRGYPKGCAPSDTTRLDWSDEIVDGIKRLQC